VRPQGEMCRKIHARLSECPAPHSRHRAYSEQGFDGDRAEKQHNPGVDGLHLSAEIFLDTYLALLRCWLLLPGGLHLTTFVMYTSSRLSPALAKASVNNLPALPTKGLPCKSSSSPGPSPTTMISADGLPSPGTALRLLSQRGHSLHTRTSPATSSNTSAEPIEGPHIKPTG
jgi:hypothetical protein